MDSLVQIFNSFTESPIGQIIISTISSGGIVSLWFKNRSDKEIERIKKQLEIYYFNETLGRIRADDQQATAIKKIWDTFSDWTIELQNFVIHGQLMSGSDEYTQKIGQEKFNESLNVIGLKLKSMENELNKFAVQIDEETYSKTLETYIQISSFFSEYVERIQKVSQQAILTNPEKYQENKSRISNEIKKIELVKIQAILNPLVQLMRVKLRIIDL
ncbi:MAG: hypothetical protein Q8L15_17515 [Methylobacter sp.]|nr:hypothetical protein [Methylobacter sp.]